MTKIKYEKHPVSPERKAELRADGYKIIDARFKPDKAGDAPVDNDLESVREKYQEVVGKKPYHGWDAETLNDKIAEAE